MRSMSLRLFGHTPGYGLAAAVTLAFWFVLPLSLWIVLYVALWVSAALTGAGLGSIAVLPVGCLLLGIVSGALSALVFTVGFAGDLVRRLLGLPPGAIPIAIGAISAISGMVIPIGTGKGALDVATEGGIVALAVLIGSASCWGPLVLALQSRTWMTSSTGSPGGGAGPSALSATQSSWGWPGKKSQPSFQ